MSFFSRLSAGWSLAKVSFATINENRSLLLFPVFSGISLLLVLATFFGGGFFLIGGETISNMFDSEEGNLYGYGLIFLYYLINYCCIVFFNSALIHCAIKILNGEPTSLQEGLSFAFSRIDKILGWAVVSATVGTLLQALHNTGKIGEIVSSLIGVAWSILTFFVVPILVYENMGVVDSIKASGRLMKEKWGESLAANVSFGLLNFLAILLTIGLSVMLMQVNFWLGLVVGLAVGLLILTVFEAARNVFVAAVYNHTVGRPAGNFDGDMLDSAFISKR